MKKLSIRKAETLKTTDAAYVYNACPWVRPSERA